MVFTYFIMFKIQNQIVAEVVSRIFDNRIVSHLPRLGTSPDAELWVYDRREGRTVVLRLRDFFKTTVAEDVSRIFDNRCSFQRRISNGKWPFHALSINKHLMERRMIIFT